MSVPVLSSAASSAPSRAAAGPGGRSAGGTALLRDPAFACLALFLALFAALLAHILHLEHGHLSYSIDDPYIHMALAERLARGLYGLNLGEIEAPSSSILWPFLLIPGCGTAWHPFLPLAYNLVFGALTALLMGRMARDWMPRHAGGLQLAACWGVSLLLVFAANLAGLAFLGMEHSLQVLLAALCAFGLVEAYRGRPVPAWCIAAAILAPAVRYECYSLCVAIAIALFAQRRRGAAIAVLTVSLLVPAFFALFLLRHGLPPLPNSVLVKGGAFASSRGVGRNLLTSIAGNSSDYVLRYHRWPMTVLVLPLVALLWRERANPLHRAVLGAAAAALILHMVMGSYGWFYRYEVYAKVPAIFVVLAAAAGLRQRDFAAALGCIAFSALPYGKAAAATPIASRNIYLQQYQMHRFEQSYAGNVAVNDLGWVSYQARPSAYVLDLVGLASLESMRQHDKGPAWLDSVTRRHAVGLVMIYPGWISDVPGDWTPLGRLRLDSHNVSGGEDDVYFYQTPFATAQQRLDLPAELRSFAATLPPGVSFTPGEAIPASYVGTGLLQYPPPRP